MEWIRISANKLKIMLSAEDTRRYELDCESSDYADVMTRAAFREILTDVRRETGFDATEDKVYIQMYPSKEGGCELFVTKIGLLLTEEDAAAEGQAPTPTRAPRGHTSEVQMYYVFDSLPALLSLCRRLRGYAPARESCAWRDECGRWWLFLAVSASQKTPWSALLREYGREMPGESAALYLGEHAEKICERAIHTLGDC